jgi:hypothetical protein
MPILSFDLQDGKPPVSFSINNEGAERFMAFMAECQAARDDAKRLDFTEQPGVMIDGGTSADDGEPGWYVNGLTYSSGFSLRECLDDAMRNRAKKGGK